MFKTSRKHNKKKTVKGHYFIIVVIIGVVFTPVLLDQLYGAGVLSIYPNHFSASDWFTFIGSYLPAVIFGIITYYNTVLVSRQQDEINSLRSLHRFKLANEATLYRYGDTSTNRYYCKVTKSKFEGHLEYAKENALKAEFTIIDLVKIADIVSVSFISAEWSLFVQPQQEEGTGPPTITKGLADCDTVQGYEHKIVVFMLIDKFEVARKNTEPFFNNYARGTEEYNRSDMRIRVALNFQDGTTHCLLVNMELQPNRNTTLAKAVNYYCLFEEG